MRGTAKGYSRRFDWRSGRMRILRRDHPLAWTFSSHEGSFLIFTTSIYYSTTFPIFADHVHLYQLFSVAFVAFFPCTATHHVRSSSSVREVSAAYTKTKQYSLLCIPFSSTAGRITHRPRHPVPSSPVRRLTPPSLPPSPILSASDSTLIIPIPPKSQPQTPNRKHNNSPQQDPPRISHPHLQAKTTTT